MPKSTLRYQRQMQLLQAELQDVEQQMIATRRETPHPSLKARKASILRSLRWYASRQEPATSAPTLHKAQRAVQAGA